MNPMKQQMMGGQQQMPFGVDQMIGPDPALGGQGSPGEFMGQLYKQDAAPGGAPFQYGGQGPVGGPEAPPVPSAPQRMHEGTSPSPATIQELLMQLQGGQ